MCRQEWSRAVYVRMPGLPPQLQRQAELAAKHLRRMDWQRAALGASFASVAVLSVLLYNSYTTNRCFQYSGVQQHLTPHCFSRVQAWASVTPATACASQWGPLTVKLTMCSCCSVLTD